MKNIILIIFLLNALGYAFNAHSSDKKVVYCEYNYGNSSIVLQIGNGSSITTIRNINDLEYVYHVENIYKLTENNDYASILNKKGEKITFFMNCK